MFAFMPINEENANTLLRIKGEGDYSYFDLDKNITDLDNLINNEEFDFFIAKDDDNQMVGFIECTFDKDEILEIGCGLLPEFMGLGYGFDFVTECVDYLVKYYDYSQEVIMSYIKHSDVRVIKVMERVGFKITDESEDWVELSLDV